MGMFGDKDLKKLDNEISKILTVLRLFEMGVVPDSQKALAGINASARDVAVLVKRLRASGKSAEAEAALAKLKSDKPEVEAIVTKIRASIREALGAG